MKRRTVIQGILAAGIAVALYPVWHIKERKASRADIGTILRRHLAGVEIPDSVVEEFCADLDKYNPVSFHEATGHFKLAHTIYFVGGPNQEEMLCKQFLLSSNILTLKDDQPVEYISWFDPRSQPCRNPFAKYS